MKILKEVKVICINEFIMLIFQMLGKLYIFFCEYEINVCYVYKIRNLCLC